MAALEQPSPSESPRPDAVVPLPPADADPLLEASFSSAKGGSARQAQPDANVDRAREPDPARPVYIQTVHGVGYKFVRERNSGE